MAHYSRAAVFRPACILLFSVLFSFSSNGQPISGIFFHQILFLLEAEPVALEVSLDRISVKQITSSSEKLCEEGLGFHNETKKCHKFLEQGPCGELQLFYSNSHEEKSNYGTCACMSNQDGCNKKVTANRMILSGQDDKQCYWAFSQGPCKENQWYVLNSSTHLPECQTNPCLDKAEEEKSISDIVRKPESDTDVFTFVEKGICYKTFTQAICPVGQYAQFVGSHSPFPKCFRIKSGPPTCLFSVGSSAGLPCDAGYKLVGDDCILMAEFD